MLYGVGRNIDREANAIEIHRYGDFKNLFKLAIEEHLSQAS